MTLTVNTETYNTDNEFPYNKQKINIEGLNSERTKHLLL